MKKFQTQKTNSYSKIFAFCQNFNEKYCVIDKLAQGHSANVFLIKDKQTEAKYALKAFNHLSTQGRINCRRVTPGLQSIQNELEINHQLNSLLRKSEQVHLPRLVEAFQEKKETLLVFELLEGDITHSKMELRDLPHMLEDVSRALASLHSRGFVHFDIRPENVLFAGKSPLPGKVDSPAMGTSVFNKNNSDPGKMWFKNLKLLEQFDFSDTASGLRSSSQSSRNVGFRKRSPRRRFKRVKKLHSLMEQHYLGAFFQKQSRRRNSRKIFKLSDFGLSFNQSFGGLLGFGDNEYLAPELLRNSHSGSQVNMLFRPVR